MNTLTMEIITKNLNGQLDGKDLLPINIIGKPGTGKTATCRKLAEDMDAGFINLSLPNTRLEQWSGIPNFVTSADLSKYSVSGAKNIQGTVWTAPEIIVNANRLAETKGKCVILLDDFHELSRNKAVMSIMYEFLLERKLGDLKLHPKVALIAAMNDSEQAGFNGLSSAVNDRLSMMIVEYDHEYWMGKYGRMLHHFISSFLKGNANFVIEAESTTVESAGSPRSWTYFSNSLELYDEQFIINNSLFLAKQFMSQEAAEAFTKHVLYISTIDFTNVVSERRMQKVCDLPFTDKMLWPNIIQYISTPSDAAYIIDLVNFNASDDLFVGYIASELYVKYIQKQEGRTITAAQNILIDKLMGSYNANNYSLKEKESELLAKASFKNQTELLNKAAQFIL